MMADSSRAAWWCLLAVVAVGGCVAGAWLVGSTARLLLRRPSWLVRGAVFQIFELNYAFS